MLGMVPTSSLAAGRLMPAAMNMPSSSLLVRRDSRAFTMISGTPPALASLSSNLGSCMCSASQRTCPISNRLCVGATRSWATEEVTFRSFAAPYNLVSSALSRV